MGDKDKGDLFSKLCRVLFVNGWGESGKECPNGGTLLFKEACKLTHSCDPNCYVLPSISTRFVVLALKPMKRGEMVTISYLGTSGRFYPRYWRQKTLSYTKCFECRCTLCSQESDRNIRMFCESCGDYVLVTELLETTKSFKKSRSKENICQDKEKCIKSKND